MKSCWWVVRPACRSCANGFRPLRQTAALRPESGRSGRPRCCSASRYSERWHHRYAAARRDPVVPGHRNHGRVMSSLIRRNTTIPASAKEMFTTHVDGQTGVDIHILQGNANWQRIIAAWPAFVSRFRHCRRGATDRSDLPHRCQRHSQRYGQRYADRRDAVHRGQTVVRVVGSGKSNA